MTRFARQQFLLGVVILSGGALSASAWASEKVAEVINIRGQVEVLSKSGQLRVLSKGSELHEMETVVTGQDGRAKILFIEGKNEVVVGTQSRLQIQIAGVSEAKPGTSLFLESGEVRSSVNRKYSGEGKDVFEVHTPNAVAGVRGTIFHVGYDVRQNSTVVATLRGLVAVHAGSSNPALVARGQFTTTMRGVLQNVRPIDRDAVMQKQLQRFERATPSDSNSSKNDVPSAKDSALATNAASAAGIRQSPGIHEAQALSEKFGFPVESTLNFVKSDRVSDSDKEKAIVNLGSGGGVAAAGSVEASPVSFDMIKKPTFVQPPTPVEDVAAEQQISLPVRAIRPAPIFVKPTIREILTTPGTDSIKEAAEQQQKAIAIDRAVLIGPINDVK
ncbi:MAG: FecR domain-containing protein [Bdellovibrionota bacterium]